MSKSRSKWKNRSDGQTVRRNSVAQYFTSRPVELLESPAMRVLSRSEHLALNRLEIELRRHAGNGNGKLIVTKQQFVEFGLHPRLVAPTMRTLEALGIIRMVHGRGGNAEHRQPNRFLLNFLCGAVDAHDQVTDAWKGIATMKQANEIARRARVAKDEDKVAYGRRQNISRVHKVAPVSGAQSGPETENFSGAQSGPTGPGAQSGPTIDISGGGGERAGSLLNGTAATAAPVLTGSASWSPPPKLAEFNSPPRRFFCEPVEARLRVKLSTTRFNPRPRPHNRRGRP
jgi:hypothetical protein